MTVGIGIVGAGFMGRLQASSFATAGASVRVIVDPDEEPGRSLAEVYGARWVRTTEELVSLDEVAALVVTAPSFLHREICASALRAGKAVLCEKTLASSLGDAFAIVEEVRATGGKLQVGYMKRHHPGVIQFIADAAELGPVEAGELRCFQPMRNWPLSSWLVDASLGGGVLMHGASHTIDVALAATRMRPSAITAALVRHPDAEVEHSIGALLEFDGTPITLQAGWFPHMAGGRYGTGWDEQITLRSQLGWARIVLPNFPRSADLPVVTERFDASTGIVARTEHAATDWFVAQAHAFLGAVAGDWDCTPDAATAIDVDRVIAAGIRSATERRRIGIEELRG